jgi:hypothetical protein
MVVGSRHLVGGGLAVIPSLPVAGDSAIFTVAAMGAAAVLVFLWPRATKKSSLWAYGVAVAAWVLVRSIQVRHLGWGHGFDVGLYESYGRSMGNGAAPYVEFSPEYPPGALLLFLIPRLFGDANAYTQAFVAEMAAFDLMACLFVVAWAKRLRSSAPFFPLWPTAIYLLFTAALYPVLYSRFDIAPAALVIAAVYFAYGQYFRWGAALLGAAAAVKLWPLALGPLWLGLAWRQGGWRRAFETGVWIAVGVLVPCAPSLSRAGMQVLTFLQYHEARGIEVGSTWASMALILNLLKWIPAQANHDFGAFHIKGDAATWFTGISTYVMVLAALAPQVVAFVSGGLGRAEDADGKVGLRASCATALGFMIGGKVLSPQFALWLAPLLPVAAAELLPTILSLASAALTTAYYPFTAEALEMVAPGHARAVAVIATRNALFIAIYAWLVFWLWTRKATRSVRHHPAVP